MSSGVRPKLQSRSSSMSLSQRRIRCFAGSSLARTGLRTRRDRAFPHLARRFPMFCCGPCMAVTPSVSKTEFGAAPTTACSESSEHDREVCRSKLSWLCVTASSPLARIGLQS